MFYDDKVKIPNAPGKLMTRKEHKAAYVMYEYDRTYNRETQKTNPKRTIIGKLCEDDPSYMYPNDRYYDYFAPEKKPMKENSATDKDIERLEIKISYLEAENAELNEVVIDLNKKVSVMMAQFEELKKKVKDLMDNSGEERVSRRPPHY